MLDPKNASQTALPARFQLNPSAFEGLTVQTLEFPFTDAVNRFRDAIKAASEREGEKTEYALHDFRQLNNALLACLPTLTHGFELYGSADDEERGKRRALAVGTPHHPLKTPSSDQMTLLLRAWALDTAGRYEGRGGDFAAACESLRFAVEATPDGWGWREIEISSLVPDPGYDNSIGFTAIPALLSTLLHGRTCTVVSPKGRELSLRWRKAQGAIGGDRTGLFVVSNPFYSEYQDPKGRVREGYFSCRLDFRIETQAGRFNEQGKLRPWVFVFLSCQRYGHEPLAVANYGRNLSFLVSVKAARIPGYPFDETLVRLTAKNNSRGDILNFEWHKRLPYYLSLFQASDMTAPEILLQNPAAYANLGGAAQWCGDEYYLVNASGYKYTGKDGSEEVHAVEPGYSLRQRADVMGGVLKLLAGALQPDETFLNDLPAPKGAKTPTALRSHHFFRKSASVRTQEKGRQGVARGIAAATGGRSLHLSLLWREAATKEAAHYFIREALCLKDGDPLPDWLHITEQFLDDDHLTPLAMSREEMSDTDEETSAEYEKASSATKSLKLAWDAKYTQWYDSAAASGQEAGTPNRLALAEIGRSRQNGISPQQAIRGAVRAAHARAGISSQFVQTAQLRKTPKEGKSPYKDETEHRFRNAILDVLLRHTGALMGDATGIYRAAKIPGEIADNLDIIAFCRRRCNKQYGRGDMQYTLAVRLRATGAVEVMLPAAHEWIPYVQAGSEVGKRFFAARNDKMRSGRRFDSAIKLNGAQLAAFVARVLTSVGEQPTLALIEARGWRNGRGTETEGKVWPQLANPNMLRNRDVLDFSHVPDHNIRYTRADDRLSGLLGVIRLRDKAEAPQYATQRETWDSEESVRDFQNLSGFLDWSARPLLHYYSVGKSPVTARTQDDDAVNELYKTENSEKRIFQARGEVYAAGLRYQHPQMVELVPFFVRHDFDSDEGMAALCRAAHYLRSSPAWPMGNLDSPYPMHLGDALINDQLCILGLDD